MENKLTKVTLFRQYSVADRESSLPLCRQGTLGPAAGSISATQPHCTWCNPLLFLTHPNLMMTAVRGAPRCHKFVQYLFV